MAGVAQLQRPDGLRDGQAAASGWLSRYANPLSLAILAALLLLALVGIFVGGNAPPIMVAEDTATVTVFTAPTRRNGRFFETRIDVTARADIADLVIAVPPALWRDMTIDTMIPAASGESLGRGGFRFNYGPLAAGDSISLRIDGQIDRASPSGADRTIAVLDGDRRIGAIHLQDAAGS